MSIAIMPIAPFASEITPHYHLSTKRDSRVLLSLPPPRGPPTTSPTVESFSRRAPQKKKGEYGVGLIYTKKELFQDQTRLHKEVPLSPERKKQPSGSLPSRP